MLKMISITASGLVKWFILLKNKMKNLCKKLNVKFLEKVPSHVKPKAVEEFNDISVSVILENPDLLVSKT